MKRYSPEHIRNIAVVGHGGTGKTSLVEAMLFHAKAIDRLGKVDDGTTTTEAAVGMGKLRVIVPRDANVEVDARVKAGNIDGDLAPTPDEGGIDLHETFSAGGREGGGPDLRLELRVGVGELEVDRA